MTGRILVFDDIDRLASDMRGIAVNAAAKLSPVVKRNVEAVERAARGFAQAESGVHGKNYYKRITSEMTGPLQGEAGPHGDVAGNAVGAGWRNRPANSDQDRAADIIGPRFADEVGDEADGWFW